MPKKIPDKKRINLELPGQLLTRIEHVKELSEAESVSEVLRSALAIYEYLWFQKKHKAKIIIRRRGGKEIELDLLPMLLKEKS